MPLPLLRPIQVPNSRQRHAYNRTSSLPSDQLSLLAPPLFLFASQIFEPLHQTRLQLLLLRPLARLPLHPTAGQHHRRDNLQLRRLLRFRFALWSNAHPSQELEVDFVAIGPLAIHPPFVTNNVGNDEENTGCRWMEGISHTKPHTYRTASSSSASRTPDQF